jgi:lipopolysaccharide transport system ATP-binding protein
MSDIVITVERLSKCYLIGRQSDRREQYMALRDIISREARNFVRKATDLARGRQIVQGDEVEELWALKNVSFEVKQGDVVGIIGRNGAGKSTLLKVLSRITEPTEGQVRLRGRVGSLLEVGIGFHPELSGRENIYLNGAILGMKRAEIQRKFDEIVAFAEIDRFVDTPVKRYSSGMYVRLAFAVAAHLEPEILVVDEILAVGDAEFQKKCLGKMDNVAREGRTVLFVSHNMTAVSSLCTQAVLMEGGRIAMTGPTNAVVDFYASPAVTGDGPREWNWSDMSTAPGDDRVRVRKVEVIADGSEPSIPLELHTSFKIAIEYWNLVQGANLILEIIVRAPDGGVLFHSLSSEDKSIDINRYRRGLYRSVCSIPANLLNEGYYRVELHFIHGNMSEYTSLVDTIGFFIQDTASRGDSIYFGRFIGTIHPRLQWRTTPIASEGKC